MSVRRRMMLSLMTMVGLLGIGLAAAIPAYAAPPPRGVVVEGRSVPGVALGTTRANADRAWGARSYCQGATDSLCTYNSGAGSADLTFSGPGGGSDTVTQIDWTGFPRWRTTAGVTTASALARPESVVRAYPHAQVYRYGDGHLYAVVDKHLGITVYWIPVTYSSEFYVWILIYPGQ